VRCRARLGSRLGLNSFIQTRQMYTYEIPMGNRVRIIASQTHTRLPNGWSFCPISIPMGTIFVPYPYPNRGIPHGLAGIGSPLTSLTATDTCERYSARTVRTEARAAVRGALDCLVPLEDKDSNDRLHPNPNGWVTWIAHRTASGGAPDCQVRPSTATPPQRLFGG
jgi:hypothetical protein